MTNNKLNQEQKNSIFATIVDNMKQLYADKNEMYGDSFNTLMHKHGLVAGLIPIENKVQRIESILQLDKTKFESLEDSLTDLACYSILFLIHLQELECMNTK